MKRLVIALFLCLGSAFSLGAYAATYPLGRVTNVIEHPDCRPVNGVNPCGMVTNEDCALGNCSLITISCAGVDLDMRAVLRTRLIAGSAPRDTALFLTGGRGTALWGTQGRPAHNAIMALVNAGFRTVELAWVNRNWAVGNASPDIHACRPATAASYVYDKHGIGQTGAYFHVTGNSSGAAQLGYMLSHYGLDTKINVAIPTSGPPFARFDLGCLRNGQPGYDPALEYDDMMRGLIDWTFGFTGDAGPCQDVIAEPELTTYRNASLAYGGNDYHHPTTFVQFIFGGADETNALAQGRLYYDRLLQEGTPHLAQKTIAGVPHELNRYKEGANAVIRTMLIQRNPGP
jgi:hypothetical protein